MSICRTCLSNYQEFIPIFDKNRKFVEQIKLISGVDIQDDDDLPKVICNNCIKNLNISCKFQRKVQNSNKILQERLKLKKNIKTVECKIPIDLTNSDDDEESINNSNSKIETMQVTLDNITFYSGGSDDLDEEEEENLIEEKIVKEITLITPIENYEVDRIANDDSCESTSLGINNNRDIDSEKLVEYENIENLTVVEIENVNFIEIEGTREKGSETSKSEIKDAPAVIRENSKKNEFIVEIENEDATIIEYEDAMEMGYKDASEMEYKDASEMEYEDAMEILKRESNAIETKNTKEVTYTVFEIVKFQDTQRTVINQTSDIERNNEIEPIKTEKNKSSKKRKGMIYKCPQCDYVTAQRSLLRYHLISKHRPNREKDDLICCKICNVVLTSDKMRLHFLSHSTDLMCKECGKVCVNKQLLNQHIKMHVKKKSTCEFCGRNFDYEGAYISHIATHKSGTNVKKCDVCKKLIRVNCFQKHYKTHDKQPAVFKCEFCNKVFSSLYVLQTHWKQHKDKSPYRCEICDCKFKDKNVLKWHIEMKHVTVTFD